MCYNDLTTLRDEVLHKQNLYYVALRNYGESCYHYDEQNPEKTHERLERVYQRFLNAKQRYLEALDEFYDTPMTEYTSF